jgi:AcrR family transcriptional regulator
MLDLSTPKGRIVAAALRLAGERPWRDVTLADIATAADVRLVDLRREFATKGEILAAFVRAVDDAVLARAPQRASSQSARDAVFDVVMSRFDVLAPYKPALKSIAASWPCDPALLGALAVSPAWMLRAAAIAPEGLEGQVRTVGLAAVYASVFRTWLDDDDPGLARTMAGSIAGCAAASAPCSRSTRSRPSCATSPVRSRARPSGPQRTADPSLRPRRHRLRPPERCARSVRL